MKVAAKAIRGVSPNRQQDSPAVLEASATYAIWKRVRIGEALKLINGRAFKPSEWSQQGRPIVRIQNLNNPDAPFNFYDGELPAKFGLTRGDLLFAWSGTPGTSFGAHIWRGDDAWLNQHIFKVIFDETQFDKRFLRYAINQNLNQYIAAAHGGAGLAHITKGKFEAHTIICPPHDEQKCIVAEIEKQFSRLDEVIVNLKRLGSKAESYCDSVLASVCGNEAPRRPLGSLLREPLRNGHSAKAVPYGDGLPTFTLSAVTDGDFSDQNIKQTIANPNRVRDLWVKSGDIFVERSNTPELVGTACLYRGKDDRAIFPDLLIRVRVAAAVLPEWVELCLLSPTLRRYFKSRAQGIAGSMPKIDQDVVNEALIPVPPVAMQKRLVAEVERCFSVIANLEAQVLTGLVRAVRLRHSILARAFHEELGGSNV